MATPPLQPQERTLRRYVRAYVAVGMEPTNRRQERADRLLTGLSHWYADDLDPAWDCDCDACAWWRDQLVIHRSGRARN